MTQLLLVSAVLVPLLAALGALFAPARPLVSRLLPILPLPALLAASVLPATTEVSFGWLVFSSAWSLDATRSTLLAATSLVWCIGGGYALVSAETRDRMGSLVLPWTAALTGNMWVAVAQDVGGFYSGFALMSFAAYGLLVQRDTPSTSPARAAGRRYLAFTVLGEMAILCGLWLASYEWAGSNLADVSRTIENSARPELISALLLAGFGVKCAMLGLHFWLPTVYTNASAPVRVVLGGAMINAGVLGWLATLPIGSGAAAALALPLVFLGLVAAFGAALVGVLQSRTATVLAYSSISQMGLITALVGVALAAVGLRAELVGAVAVFAAHHGLTKGALFLNADVVESAPKRWVLFAVPALALAGAPFTSGALAKLMTKEAVYAVGWDWLTPWLTFAAVGTTVLMARALWCAMRAPRSGHDASTRGTLSAAALSTLLVVVTVLWLPRGATGSIGAATDEAISLLWPIGAGVLVSGWLWRRRKPGASTDAMDETVANVQAPARDWPRARLSDTVGDAASAALEASRAFALTALSRVLRLAHPERSDVWLRRHASIAFVVLMLALFAALL
jgi:hydrogenase-4 component B